MHPADDLPSDIREAIGDGWAGVTMVAPRLGAGTPTLVCAAPRHLLGALQGGGLALDVPTVSSAPGSRALHIRLEPHGEGARAQRPLEMVLDLAFAEARALIGGAVERGGVDLMWVASEPPHPAARESIALEPAEVDALAGAVARAAEWHAAIPLPLGLDEDRWRRAARDAPALVDAARGPGEVILVVPAGTLAGLAGRCGRVCFAAGEGATGGRSDGDLLVRFLWGEGLDEVERHAHLGLHCRAQRRMVAQLSCQRSLLVLGAGPRFAPGPCVRVTLTAPARALLAARAAEPPWGSAGSSGCR